MAGAAGGIGIAIAAVVEGEAAHQVGLHHRKLVVAHGALGVLGIQLLHINRQQAPGAGGGPGLHGAIAATAGALHVDEQIRQPIAVDVCHFGTHHPALHGFLDRCQGLGAMAGLHGELLDRALTSGGNREAVALQVEAAAERGPKGRSPREQQGRSKAPGAPTFDPGVARFHGGGKRPAAFLFRPWVAGSGGGQPATQLSNNRETPIKANDLSANEVSPSRTKATWLTALSLNIPTKP